MLKFAKTHEWADIVGSKAKVGISEYAAKELGDVVFVSLPKIGQQVKAGESFCEVESVKAVSEILAPVSGTVSAVNSELEDSPEKINENPMAAWMAEIDVVSVSDLMSKAEYDAMEK